jgi:hypothetical protein
MNDTMMAADDRPAEVENFAARLRGRAGRYHFAARLDEPAFMAQASRRVVEGTFSLGPDAVAASYVDVLAERDPEQLAELARLIRRRLRDREQG